MNRTITFEVSGIAQPKGSTRMLPLKGKRGGRRIITSANPKASAWQRAIAWTARQQTNGGLLFGPIAIQAIFYLPRPVSLPRQITSPVRKPDLDKLLRCLCDALTGVVYHDDAQVTDCQVSKRFAAALPHAVIVVKELEP
jgi:Holliday junction resolvase RusA-like endonuclease